MCSIVNSLFNVVFDVLLWPLQALPETLQLCALGLPAAIFALLVFRFTSNQAGIEAAKDKIKDLRKKLQDCLKSCPPEVTLEIDSTSHVAFHALGDPSTALGGIEGANWFQLPAEVGNGWLVSVPVGAEGQLGDLVEGGTLEKIGKDYCRIMQPLAPTLPSSQAPTIDAPLPPGLQIAFDGEDSA